MCGIAGMVRYSGLASGEHTTGRRMAATLAHRGPDENGWFADTHASLGHARLSVIDLQAGRQPMGNENGTVQVVYNGEIYNHQELTERLRAHGHHLHTRCDTEILPHLYEEYGENFVEHLNGMFAIAVWDARQKRLLLVRDRLGIKPLYWHDDGRRVVFGSELKAVLAAGGIDTQIDARSVCDYFTFGHVPAPRTIYQHVHKLEPGCMAICTAGSVAVRRYWDIPSGDEFHLPPRAWQAEFADLLEDAVGKRLIADVPIGAFLSGGVDSATIAAAMRRQAAGAVVTQTVGFDEQCCDEREGARAVADRLGTDHREVMVRPDAVAAIDRLARHFDEPFADPCAVPMLYLCEATRQRVTVALSGDGGDEMLAGYRRYRFDLTEHRLRQHVPSWLRQFAAGTLGAIYPKADWLPRTLRAQRTLRNLATDDITAHLASVAIEGGQLPAVLIRDEWLRETAGYDAFDSGREWFARCNSRDLLNRLLYVDMKTLLADEILTKVDRTSMAVSLEVRVPLLDYRLVEFCARMPSSMKYDGSQGKHILRQTASNWLGDEIASRTKKGFDVPLDDWFRGPLREMSCDLLESRDSVSKTWLNSHHVQQIVHQHQQGRRCHGRLLWVLLAFETWARSAKIKGDSPELQSVLEVSA